MTDKERQGDDHDPGRGVIVMQVAVGHSAGKKAKASEDYADGKSEKPVHVITRQHSIEWTLASVDLTVD